MRDLLQLVADNLANRFAEWTDREPLMGETLVDRLAQLLSPAKVTR